MKIYISLPITDYDLQERKSFAERLKKHLQLINPQAEIVTPFDVNPVQELSYAEYMGNDIAALLTSDAEYMGNDIAALLTSDAVYFCKGWGKSRGCRLEHSAAMEYKISKIYEQWYE